MSMRTLSLVLRATLLALVTAVPLQAQPHTARRLGHPSTRFADPVQSPEDLRERLTSEQLATDVAIIVNLCDGWRGDIEDFREAAATAPIAALQIPVGTRLPAMSSRRNGRPILLRDVLWGGTEPIDAYEFLFYSRGRRYRCVTPKPCCNFWVENIGPDLRAPALALTCEAPAEVTLGRPVEVCLTVRNTGDARADQVTVSLPIPEGAVYAGPVVGSNPAARRMIWRIPGLAPGAARQICAEFSAPDPADLTFASTAEGGAAASAATQCVTRVSGIPAVLFEVIDVADPIEVGQQNTYELNVLNQGSSPLTSVRLVCTLEDTQEFVTAGGATTVEAKGRTLVFAPLPVLAPKATAGWQVVVKALAAADVRFTAELTSTECPRPVQETEATRQY